MTKEIERKFLVTGDEWRKLAQGEHISQSYLGKGKNCVFRVRTRGERALLGIKGKRKNISADEFEYEIPLTDARKLIEHYAEHSVIEKKRHIVEHAGHIWEIDEFFGENAGLIMAEIELASEGEKFSKPGWIGEEVSLDPRYANFNLAQNPYKNWGIKQT